VPSFPPTSDKREKYLAAAIVVWSVPPFPSPRAWFLPAVEKVETGAGRPGAGLRRLDEALAHTPLARGSELRRRSLQDEALVGQFTSEIRQPSRDQ
jgi:hypothetical protein